MKITKYLFISGILLLTLACRESTQNNHPPKESEKVTPETLSTRISLQSTSLLCRYNGSTVGEIIQIYYKTGQWTLLEDFISEQSIEKFGRESIILAFMRTEFGYKIQLKSYKNLADGTIQLNYQTIKFGTLGILRIQTHFENDTCKVILRSIEPTVEF